MSYTVGLIGAGAVSDWHAEAFSAIDGAELVAVADVQEDALLEKAEKWEVSEAHCYLDHEGMLETESLDIVSVTTPTAFHHEHTLDTIRIADPAVVWCEKPIATSVAEAEEMVERCEKEDIELVVNHVRRWAKPYQKLKSELVTNGIVGDTQTVHAQFKAELLRNGTHFVDTLYWLLGTKAVLASGYLNDQSDFDSGTPTIETADFGGGGFLVLDEGTFVTLDCSVPRQSFSGWFAITGSEGRLYFNESDEVANYWSIDADGHTEKPLDPFSVGWTKWSSPFERAAENIVQLADGTGVNESPGHEAVDVLEMIVALFVSYYTSSTVTLPLDPPLRTVSISSW